METETIQFDRKYHRKEKKKHIRTSRIEGRGTALIMDLNDVAEVEELSAQFRPRSNIDTDISSILWLSKKVTVCYPRSMCQSDEMLQKVPQKKKKFWHLQRSNTNLLEKL